MPRPSEPTKWLIDTNILVDFIIGYAYTVKKHEKNKDPCKAVLDKTKALLSEVRGSTELLLTQTTLNELERVLIRGKVRETLQQVVGDVETFRDKVLELLRSSSPPITIVDASEDELRVAEQLRELRISYPREDLHVIAAAATRNPSYLFTDEEGIQRALRKLIDYGYVPRIEIQAFGGFIDGLRVLGVLSFHERLLIGYYAYKYQRLFHSHNRAYQCGERRDPEGLKQWVHYARSRLQQYLPVISILKLKTHL